MRLYNRLPAAIAAVLLLSCAAAAATVRWTGAAQDVRQVTTITVTGTWATGDAATLTINNKSLVVTIGSATSTSNVATALAAAVDAASATEDLAGDESRNFGGQEIPEFAELDASSSGAVLTLTSATPGVPFTVTRSEVTAGDGALGAVTAVTAATGKNWLSNAANYSGGSIPVDNDVLVFDSGDVDVLYALDHFRSGSIDLDVYVSNEYTGQIGNPVANPNGYVEYRTPRYFQWRGTSKKLVFTPGSGVAVNQGDVRIDCDTPTSPVIHVGAWRGPTTGGPHIFLANSGASNVIDSLVVTKGAVSVEPDEAPTAAGQGLRINNVNFGSPAGAPSDAYLEIGRNARMHLGTAFYVYSGALVTYSPTKVAADDAAMTIYGGAVELRADGDHGDITVNKGGALYSNAFGNTAATLSNVYLYGGTLSYERATYPHVPDSVKVYAGATVIDPDGATGPGLHLLGCSPADVTLKLPTNRLFVFNTAATP